MKSQFWFGIAFCAALGLGVGLRLSAADLLLLATLLLGVLLCPMLAILWKLAETSDMPEIEVRVEKPQPRALLRAERPRRGAWSHQRRAWFGAEEAGRAVADG